MKGQNQALLTWLSITIHKPQINSVQQLRDGLYLQQACNKITGIKLQLRKQNDGWKDAYFRLSNIYNELKIYMKETINYTFTNGISTINPVDIAKGQDDQGLISLLKLIFIISKFSDTQTFAKNILTLSSQDQQQLMQILIPNQLPQSNDVIQIQQFEQKYEKEKEKLNQVLSIYQNLLNENESLKGALNEEAEQEKRLKEQVKKLVEQKQKLSKQILQLYKKSELQQRADKNMNISQKNEEFIQKLQSSYLQQVQKLMKQNSQLKQLNQDFQEQLNMAKNKIQDLEYTSSVLTVSDHSQCINRTTYQKQMKQLNLKLTEMSSKQWKGRIQLIRLTNLNQQLKAKNKKLIDQNSKAKENGFMIGKQDSNHLKIQFYTKLRDSLKSKLEGALLQKKSIRNIQSQNNLKQDSKNNILEDF